MQRFFPRPVNLTVPNGAATTTMRFRRGIHDVPDELADHWWLKANGVRVPSPEQLRLAQPRPKRPPRATLARPVPQAALAPPRQTTAPSGQRGPSLFRLRPAPPIAPQAVAPASPKARFLAILAAEIDKLVLETEAEAKQLIEKDIAVARTQKTAAFNQVRMALNDNRETVQGLAVSLDKISGAHSKEMSPTEAASL